MRRLIVAAYQSAIAINLLLGPIINNATSNQHDTGSYRIPIALQLACPLTSSFGMFMLPGTARYLIQKEAG